MTFFSKTLATLLLATPLAALAANAAGTVVMLTGKATALGPDGTVRKLAKNDAVYSGDLVNSGVGSYVNLKFADGAFFLLRPETRFQIEQYDYAGAAPAPSATAQPPVSTAPPATAAGKPTAPAPATPATAGTAVPAAAPLVTAPQAQQVSATSRAFFRLVKGGFRSVSGLIGKLNRDDYRVTTPVATIGIRGTHYSARLCEGACEDRDQLDTQLRKVGKAVAVDNTVLVTTVDEGGIELQSSETRTVQGACNTGDGESLTGGGASACTAVFTSSDGSIVIVPSRPAIEQSERNLDPASCS